MDHRTDQGPSTKDQERTLIDVKCALAEPSRRLQIEKRDLWPHVDPNLQEMANSSIDIERATVVQIELAARVSTVLHRQQRWRQKWRLALASVGVTAQHPSLIAVPSRPIDSIGIVALDDRGAMAIQRGQRAYRIEATPPEIVDASDLKTRYVGHLVSENRDTDRSKLIREPRGNFRMRPVGSVVVVAEDPDGRQASTRRVGVHPRRVRVDIGPVAYEVAGVDNDVWCDRVNTTEGVEDVRVRDAWADVDVTQLGERAAAQSFGETVNRQRTSNDVEPVRFTLPRVEPDAKA